MKEQLKNIIKSLPLAITKNQRYDRYTRAIINQNCKNDSNCIDIGCHKGEVLDIILRAAPEGKHYGFEPIPGLYKRLKEKYNEPGVTILSTALSNETGEITFNYVVSNPAYSGIRKRTYDRKNEQDKEIIVQTDKLDNILDHDLKIDLIKIDVEGAELLVLQGAEKLIKKHKPVVIFEHGLGASDHYGAKPEEVYDFFQEKGMQIYTLKSWLRTKESLSAKGFKNHYYNRTEYYFVAGRKE